MSLWDSDPKDWINPLEGLEMTEEDWEKLAQELKEMPPDPEFEERLKSFDEPKKLI